MKKEEKDLIDNNEKTTSQKKSSAKKQNSKEKKEPKTISAKKLPKIFRKKYLEKAYKKKILKKIYVSSDKKAKRWNKTCSFSGLFSFCFCFGNCNFFVQKSIVRKSACFKFARCFQSKN